MLPIRRHSDQSAAVMAYLATRAGLDGVVGGIAVPEIARAIGFALSTTRRGIATLILSGRIKRLGGKCAKFQTYVVRVPDAPLADSRSGIMTWYVIDRGWLGGGGDPPLVPVSLPRVRCLEDRA